MLMAMITRALEQPFSRYHEIFDVLNRRRGWFESATYLRYAAIAAVGCPGSPDQVAGQIRETAEELKKLAGWFGQLRSELRFVVAAILRLHHDPAAAFHAEVNRVQKLFRKAGLRRDATYTMLAILMMRNRLGGQPIPASQVQRVKDMYDETKRYHWWLTGADDLPACAMLSLRDQPIGLMAQHIDQIYDGLHKEGMSRGNELHACAHLLYLCKGRAELAVARAGELFRRFTTHGVKIRRSDYDELAILSFLLNNPLEIIERVLTYRDQVRRLKPRPDKRLAFYLGCSIAFLDLAPSNPDLQAVSQIKLIIDLQVVVAAQRATAALIAAAAVG